MDALVLYRIAHWFYRHKIPLIPSLLKGLIFLVFNSYLPYEARIGKRTRLRHRGISLVVNKEAVIGENVLIACHVTIGKKTAKDKAPFIGNNVEIGDGAKIIGGITVGDNVKIGANAVVVKDVPPGQVVVGVPAKILSGKQDG